MRDWMACLLLGAALGGCDRQSAANGQLPDAAGANVLAGVATPPAVPEPAAQLDISQRGSAMPADRFKDAAGKPMTLAAFKGQPLLVNLWATWCGPCVKEMPSLDRLAARTRGKLQVVTISQDSPQAVDPVPRWWAEHKLSNLALYRDEKTDLGFAYGGGMLPTTVLYDAQGREVWRILGGLDWDGPRAATLLAEYSG